MVKLWHSAVRLEWVCEDSSHLWKTLLSSFAFLSCLRNLMPKILTALDTLTVVAVDGADLLTILEESLVVPFLLPKRSTCSISLKMERQSVSWQWLRKAFSAKRNSCFVVSSSVMMDQTWQRDLWLSVLVCTWIPENIICAFGETTQNSQFVYSQRNQLNTILPYVCNWFF